MEMNNTIRKEKEKRRKLIRERAKTLPLSYFKESGRKMAHHFLLSKYYKESSSIFAYASLKREPDTFYLIEEILKDEKILALPRCLEEGQMEAVEIKSMEDLEKGSFGILEPKSSCKVLDKKELDLIYVPCLSADLRGNRLGKGGGFYDRFLSDFPGIAILSCPKELLSSEIPTDTFDQKFDLILTEEGIFQARN